MFINYIFLQLKLKNIKNYIKIIYTINNYKLIYKNSM